MDGRVWSGNERLGILFLVRRVGHSHLARLLLPVLVPLAMLLLLAPLLDAAGGASSTRAYTALDETLPPIGTRSRSWDASLSPAGAGGGWTVECVDCPKHFDHISDRGVQLDAAGNPHIVYGSNHLYYARFDGEQWHHVTVDDWPGVGAFASLALDEEGYPHIGYGGQDDIRYSFRDAAGWHTSIIATSERINGVSLALDAAGNPHLAFYLSRDHQRALAYAHHEAGEWHVRVIEGTPGLVYKVGVSLAMGGDGAPRIAYCDYNQLKYAVLEPGGWRIEVVQSGEGQLLQPSLALDARDHPHIAVGGGLNPSLKYAHVVSDEWQIETLTETGQSWENNAIAMDRNGFPHITSEWSDRYLRYFFRDATGWHSQIVDGIGGLIGGTSLALDDNGDPHSAYVLTSLTTTPGPWLVYAMRDGGAWQMTRVDRARDVGEGALALDSADRAHISYYGEGVHNSSGVQYAVRDASGWQTHTVAAQSRWSTVIDTDSAGYPHLVFKSRGELIYAHLDGAGWHFETIDSDGGAALSFALDDDDNPHISYGNPTLMYAFRRESGWYRDKIETDGDVTGTSLEIDDNGVPHIAYIDELCIPWQGCIPLGINLASLGSTGWDTELVDPLAWHSPSLAFDTHNEPCVTYSRDADLDWNRLAYACRDTTGWEIEIIDGESWDHFSSLQIDEKGFPHISYYAREHLNYAHRDAGGWHILAVDTADGVGQHTDLALDGAGLPHICYYDGISGHLKYAYLEDSLPVYRYIYIPVVRTITSGTR